MGPHSPLSSELDEEVDEPEPLALEEPDFLDDLEEPEDHASLDPDPLFLPVSPLPAGFEFLEDEDFLEELDFELDLELELDFLEDFFAEEDADGDDFPAEPDFFFELDFFFDEEDFFSEPFALESADDAADDASGLPEADCETAAACSELWAAESLGPEEQPSTQQHSAVTAAQASATRATARTRERVLDTGNHLEQSSSAM